jgi:hypothetical protein
MKGMSEFISKLEGYAELEVSIIRGTKINKVLKAILKLSEIPKEEEFNLKGRSKDLLDKWNKILENADGGVAATATPAPADKTSPKELMNGLSASKKENKNAENNGKTEEPVSAIDTDIAVPNIAEKGTTVREDNSADDPIKVCTRKRSAGLNNTNLTARNRLKPYRSYLRLSQSLGLLLGFSVITER